MAAMSGDALARAWVRAGVDAAVERWRIDAAEESEIQEVVSLVAGEPTTMRGPTGTVRGVTDAYALDLLAILLRRSGGQVQITRGEALVQARRPDDCLVIESPAESEPTHILCTVTLAPRGPW